MHKRKPTHPRHARDDKILLQIFVHSSICFARDENKIRDVFGKKHV